MKVFSTSIIKSLAGYLMLASGKFSKVTFENFDVHDGKRLGSRKLKEANFKSAILKKKIKSLNYELAWTRLS